MNEKVLDLLMQLFAQVARLDGLISAESQVVRDFLHNLLPDEVAEDYYQRFLAHTEGEPIADTAQLCAMINRDLTAQQKNYIFIRLLELVNADKRLTQQERDIVADVAAGLNLDANDAAALREFVLTDKPRQLLLTNLCIVSSGIGAPRGVRLEVPGFVGYIAILHVEWADLYVLRYIGNGEAYLNGQLLRPEQVQLFTPGSVIRTPRTQPVYFSDVAGLFWEPRQKARVVFQASGVSYRFGSGHYGLHELDVQETGGRLVALMGNSGAGKSTLLNVLNGNLKPTTGHVRINGVDVHREGWRLRGLIGYVSQSDLLLEDLTVYENLLFNAKLCFGNLTPDQVHERVLRTLQELGLTDIQHLRVGNPLNKFVSGGQRKRLNIALELIREPAVLFVDEPTSGLSSRDSENVMDLLKELAQRGTLVFVVIHQPSSDIYKLFDKLYLLDTGGYLIYTGNPLEGLRYFRRAMQYAESDLGACGECGTVNPEQMFGIVDTRLVDEYGNPTALRRVTPQRWYELFRQHQAAEQAYASPAAAPAELPELPESKLRVPGWWRQMGIFLRRDLRGKLRDGSYLAINLLEAPVLALVLAWLLRYFNQDGGSAYTLLDNQNLAAYLFTSILVGLFIGLTVSAEEILRDRRIRQREAFLHLSRGSYLFSKVLLLGVLAAIQMALYVWVGSNIMQLAELQGYHWLMLFSVAVFGNLLGLNISAAFDNAVTIYILVPVLLIPQMVLSGAMIRFHELNPQLAPLDRPPLVADFMASRWAFEGLAVQQFRGNTYEAALYEADAQVSQARYRLDDWIPALQVRLDEAANHAADVQAKPALQLVHRELDAAIARATPAQQAVLARLAAGDATPSTLSGAGEVLTALKTYWQQQLAQARAARDRALASLRAQGDLDSLRNRYHNTRLQEIVTDRAGGVRVAQADGRLVQLSDPVFRWPTGQGLRGAQFFAPSKRVGNWLLPTFWFNLAVVWAMSLLLYALLYADVLRRAVLMAGTLRRRIVRFSGR